MSKNTTDSNGAAARAVSEIKQNYVTRHPRSAAHTDTAGRSMPGGNTRTTLYYDPFPIVFGHSRGSRLTCIDGHEYVDFLGDYTAGLYGHSNPTILSALREALDDGLNFGGYNEYESKFADQLTRRFPSVELVRFTNSGTEANLLALGTAVDYTERSTIIVFSGGYHGSLLSFAEGGGSLNVPHRFRVVEYNNAPELKQAVAETSDDLAAILIEPMLGSGGSIPAERSFLELVRSECNRLGAILIFDEVMTSRLSPGGLQSLTGISPDITTLGKYLGGGMSFGAVGGRANVMRRFDPSRDQSMEHPGTFNNNALTMRAGAIGLSEVLDESILRDLNQRGDALRKTLNNTFVEHKLPMQVLGEGSLMTVHATGVTVRSVRDLSGVNELVKELYFFFMVNAGFWIARRGMISLSIAVTNEECAAFAQANQQFAERYGSIMKKFISET